MPRACDNGPSGCPPRNSIDHRQIRPGADKLCAEFEQCWASFGPSFAQAVARHRPILTEFGPTSTDVSASVARCWPEPVKFGPKSANAEIGEFWAEFEQLLRNFGRIGQS